MRTRIRLILVASLAVFGFAYAQQGTLEIAVSQAPVGLDPDIATAFSSFAVIDQIYQGLLEINSKLQLKPALATSWTISQDGLTYTFNLRRGVKFDNGREMTSADVVYSFHRIMDPKTGSPLASRFNKVTSVKAIGPYQVQFTMKAPFAPFLSNLPYLYVVPKEVVEANGNLQKVAVGTGPYELDTVVPDTYVLLKANPDFYIPGEPKLAELKYNIVPEASTQAAGIRTGAFGLLPDIDPTTAETLKRVPNVSVLSAPDLSPSRLGLNVSKPPLSDPRVREAINMAINRPDLIASVYLGHAQAGGVISPSLSDWAVPTSELACYTYNPARAKQLLAEAGYPNGFSMTVIGFSRIKVVPELAQVLQAQLAKVGIRVKIDIQPFGTFVQNWRNSNFDGFVSLSGGAIDPDTLLYRVYHTGGSANVYHYSNPTVDKLLDEGETTVNQAKRHEIYAQLQRSLSCDGPAATLAYGTLYTAVRDNVVGFQQIPTRSLLYLRQVSLK